MKKSTKIVLITAAVLAAVGIFLILISVALGGNKQYREYVRENGEVSVVLFPHSLKLRLSAGNGGLNVSMVDDEDWNDMDEDEDDAEEASDNESDDASDDDSDEATDDAWDDTEESGKTMIASESDQIEKIDLALDAGEFTIKPSGDNSFYASYAGESRLQFKKQNGMLSIQTKTKTITLFGVHDTNAGSATIYLPDQAYKKIAVSIGAGTAVSEMTLQAEKVELEVGMGTLETAVDASQKLTVDVGMGEADLTVNGSEEDYDTDISVGAGDVKCGSHDFSGLSQEYTKDKGTGKKLEIDCGMGSVNVDFLR
ncbi:DUF4097 domain-containing protein [Kineothrix sp. MSJ-39]|uniref:DUF4097 domain-containing protein n=1 Tax=Kineothrix sp. MSJ-39 TaxID=2841533 RepID=UPI001C10094F|nr:DUF4097 domain-containing protein [Kineothrix sp. MSJ-39]MBU5430094.1 DUF4097 domain-containing protein [Kineothrix sp. MSJ-39]